MLFGILNSIYGIPNTVFGILNMYLEFQIRIWNSEYVFGIPNSIFHILNLDGGSKLSYTSITVVP